MASRWRKSIRRGGRTLHRRCVGLPPSEPEEVGRVLAGTLRRMRQRLVIPAIEEGQDRLVEEETLSARIDAVAG